MSAPLRVGLLGFGVGGAVFHAPLVAATPGLELSTVVTADPGRQEEARARYPGVRVVDRPGALWDAAAEHDLAVVSTPNRSHLPLALAALDAGLPVVVDKPLAVTAADGRRLVGAAAGRGLLLTVFQNRRWDGDLRTVRRLVAEGALGPLLRVESRFERWRPLPRPGGWRETSPPSEGGGLLYDLGSHLVDQAVLLAGPPVAVYAELDRRRPGVRADDDVFVALTHPGGVRTHLWASAVAADRGPRLRVLGERAAYVKHGLDVQEDQLRAGTRPHDPAYGVEEPDRWGVLTDGSRARPVPTERGDYPAFYAAVAQALRDGRPAPVDPADAVVVLDVLEAARASAEEGRVVPLRPVTGS